MCFNLTTKWKIIAGFVVMILLMGVVAAIGYRSLSRATDSFMEYRRLARLNVLTSDMLAHEQAALSTINRFRLGADPQLMESARDEIKNTQPRIEKSQRLTNLEANQTALVSVGELLKDQMLASSALENAVMTVVTRYESEMRPAARAMSKALAAIGCAAFELGNGAACREVLAAMDHMGTVRAVFGRLAYNQIQANADRAAEGWWK